MTTCHIDKKTGKNSSIVHEIILEDLGKKKHLYLITMHTNKEQPL